MRFRIYSITERKTRLVTCSLCGDWIVVDREPREHEACPDCLKKMALIIRDDARAEREQVGG